MNTMAMRSRACALLGCCLAALLALAGCAGAPSTPNAITLAGVVVDGQRVAGADEGGLVRVQRYGAWLDGKPNMVLQPGDVVATGPTSFALVRYPSGTELFMRPNTRGRVGSFTEMVGEVFAKIRGAFAIQTSFVRAGADGTAYTVRASPDGGYAVVVFDGTVQLSSLNAAWPAVALGRGAMSMGRPHVPPVAVAASPEELARTRAWVERMEHLLPPPRHGSGAGAALAIAALVAVIAASDHHGPDSLTAPTGLAPGSVAPQAPAVANACHPLTLSWNRVNGAHDYVITLETMAPTRSVAAPSTFTSSAPSLQLPSLYGAYRWHVHARDARGQAGPESISVQFYCRG